MSMTELEAAAKEIVMQAYGARRYDGTHGPTRTQWLRLAHALVEAGVVLPTDYAQVFGGDPPDLTQVSDPDRVARLRDRKKP